MQTILFMASSYASCEEEFKWALNAESCALDMLDSLYYKLKLFNCEGLNLEKYHNYILFHTILYGMKCPKKMIEGSQVLLKYLFDEESIEKQTELLLLIQDLLINKADTHERDLSNVLETVFSFFYNSRIISKDFLLSWKQNSSSVFIDENLNGILREQWEQNKKYNIDEKFKASVSNFLGYLERNADEEDSSSDDCNEDNSSEDLDQENAESECESQDGGSTEGSDESQSESDDEN